MRDERAGGGPVFGKDQFFEGLLVRLEELQSADYGIQPLVVASSRWSLVVSRWQARAFDVRDFLRRESRVEPRTTDDERPPTAVPAPFDFSGACGAELLRFPFGKRCRTASGR